MKPGRVQERKDNPILRNPGIDIIQNSPKLLDIAIEDSVDWAQCFGLVIRTAEHKERSDICQIAPFTLLPSPFPRSLFDQACNIQQAMNLVYFKISWDYEFLINAHREVIRSDEFTRNMVQIMQKIHNEGIKQKITLLTQRADYMSHVDLARLNEEDDDVGHRGDAFKLKQIEVNNIAVSMGGLAQRATLLHRRVLHKLRRSRTGLQSALPDNEPIGTLAKGIYTAWKEFGNEMACILVVVGDENQNQMDQRYIEYELERLAEEGGGGRGIDIVRMALTQCADSLTLGGDGALLRITDDIGGRSVVGVVYFRAGYAPEDYPTQREWDARLVMERSTAIKCPWIGLQLANTKKIQQVLSLPGVLETFFSPASEMASINAIRETFARMWGLELDDEATRAIVEDAIANPCKYVLKPQTEGGGVNYFGEEVAEKLRQFSREERAAHILMEKITPLVVENYLIRALQQQPTIEKVVSELGIYGCLVGNGGDGRVMLNTAGGHILRTKLEHEPKGGVAIGAAVIDSPDLF